VIIIILISRNMIPIQISTNTAGVAAIKVVC
jgi:hypothetical protein